jgi:hypothetical protein
MILFIEKYRPVWCPANPILPVVGPLERLLPAMLLQGNPPKRNTAFWRSRACLPCEYSWARP